MSLGSKLIRGALTVMGKIKALTISTETIQASRADETSAAASYIYDSGDGFLRKKTLANAKIELVTAADILTKLKTVDGAGSGLDADTLDGYASSIASAASTVVVRDSNGYIQNNWFNSSRVDESTAAASYIYDTGDGYMRKKTLANARAEIVTAADILTKLKTVDGSGSGLDADTLDGFDGANWSWSRSLGINVDFNTKIQSGMYRVENGLVNGPGADYGQLLVIHGGGDTITQIYGNYNNGKLFTRSGNPTDVGGTGAWTGWFEQVRKETAGISGAPTSGNIDLSGVQGSGIVLKDETTGTKWHLHTHGDRIRLFNGSTEMIVATTGDQVAAATNADTVDGIHASQINYGATGYGTTNVSTLINLNKSGFYDLNGGTEMPWADWWHIINSNHTGSSAGNVYNFQLAAQFWQQKLFFRTVDPTGQGTRAWSKVVLSDTGVGKVTRSTADPSGGEDGDVWIKYNP